jgi:SHAQKYF class myb-like DNA-binding protein
MMRINCTPTLYSYTVLLHRTHYTHALYTQLINAGAYSNITSQRGENTGRWTDEEQAAFIAGLRKYGKNWKKISQMVKTRSLTQIRTHAQKFFKKAAKERVLAEKNGDTASAENLEQLLSGIPVQGTQDGAGTVLCIVYTMHHAPYTIHHPPSTIHYTIIIRIISPYTNRWLVQWGANAVRGDAVRGDAGDGARAG